MKRNELVDRMNADPLLFNKIAVASAPLNTSPHHNDSSLFDDGGGFISVE